MVKKLPKGEKIFSFFFQFISHFPSPLTEKNKTTYFFRSFYHQKQENRKGKRSIKNFFFLFFFLLFCIVPLLVIRKITTFPFFSKFRLKVPKTDAKGAQVSFFSNYLFSPRDYANTYTYPHTLRFSDP